MPGRRRPLPLVHKAQPVLGAQAAPADQPPAWVDWAGKARSLELPNGELLVCWRQAGQASGHRGNAQLRGEGEPHAGSTMCQRGYGLCAAYLIRGSGVSGGVPVSISARIGKG